MTSLVCNTPASARLLGSCPKEVSTDAQHPSACSRSNSGTAHRGPSPYPALETFLIQHALQVGDALCDNAVRGFLTAQRG